MKVKILFFGLAGDLAGRREETAEVPEGESVEGLWRAYQRRYPRLAAIAASIKIAVNEEFVSPGCALHEGDEIAVMPPVSGGSGTDFCRITRERIRAGELADQLKARADGATVVFEGIVREQSHGRRTRYLEYEAYEPMAVRAMEEIGRQARDKFEIDGIGMVHRIGRLEIGETSVAIVVTAPHRGPAFEACRFAIDRLKQTVPIWKKEFFEDGAVWAEGEGQTRILTDAGVKAQS
jgi:MoaE-MoaD fusion protein